MKIIKVYQKECTGCGHYKDEMATLKEYAQKHDSVIQVIRTPLSQKYYEEASGYDLPQPFSVIGGRAYPLGVLPKTRRAKAEAKLKDAEKNEVSDE